MPDEIVPEVRPADQVPLITWIKRPPRQPAVSTETSDAPAPKIKKPE